MAIDLARYEKKACQAVKAFWISRKAAAEQQFLKGTVDQGSRGAVTGGKNMDAFANLMADLVKANGLKKAQIVRGGRLVTLPGFFRPTKKWDLVVHNEGRLIAALEFKSQVGSFGNNFNNRTEEAVGTAHDFSIAYREGAFGDQPKPFVGWLMLLQDHPNSRTPVRDYASFPIFPDFQGASYAERYNILCKKLVQEQLYTSACIMLSPENTNRGVFTDMSDLTSLKTFVTTLAGHVAVEAARM